MKSKLFQNNLRVDCVPVYWIIVLTQQSKRTLSLNTHALGAALPSIQLADESLTSTRVLHDCALRDTVQHSFNKREHL